jgi:imidazolonepropionase-like amidohydrolase
MYHAVATQALVCNAQYSHLVDCTRLRLVFGHMSMLPRRHAARTGVIERVAWGAVDVDALTQELGEHHTIDIPDGYTLLPGLVDCHSHPTFTNDFNFSRR